MVKIPKALSLFFVLFLLALSFACNKTKRVTKKFIEAGEWEVQLFKDKAMDTISPIWIIEQTEIDKIESDTTVATWFQSSTNYSLFRFQFNDKAKTFYLYYKHQDYENDMVPSSAIHCYNYSGQYNVIERKKDFIQLESEEISQFSGKKITIKLRKR